MIVDGVDEVLTVDDAQLEDVPVADSTLAESIAKLGERLVLLLAPSTIFAGLAAA